MNRPRRLLIGALTAAVLLPCAVAAAALLIPAERVGAAVAARAEAILGERVRLEAAELDVLPLPGVRLTGLSVGGTDDSTAIATVRGVGLRVRLLPLLRGDVIVSSLDLESPRLLLRIDSAGQLNLPLLAGDTAAATEALRDIDFEIDRIRVSDGVLGFHDLRDGTVVRLDGWEQQLAIQGELRAGELERVELAGWLQVKDVDARLPDVVVPVRDVALRLTHDATLDRSRDRLDLRTLTLSLNGVELAGSGWLDSLSSATGRIAALELSAEGIDAGRLTALLPDSFAPAPTLPDGRKLQLDGLARARVTIRGPLTVDSLPSVDGSFAVEGGGIGVDGEAERLLSDVRAEGHFSTDSVVADIAGTVLGGPFTAAIAAREPAAPVVDLTLRARSDLRRLRPLGLLPDTLSLEGDVVADIRATVPTRDPAAARADGSLVLAGLRLLGSEPALAVPRAVLRLVGSRLIVDTLVVRPGREGDIRGALLVDGWIATLADSTAPPPRITGEIVIDSLDLDRLLGEPEGDYPTLLFARLGDRELPGGRPVGAVAEELGLALPDPPRVDAELRILAGRIRRSGLIYSDLDGTLRLTPTAIELAPVRFGLMGGTVHASGRFEPTRFDSAGTPIEARVVGDYGLENVTAAAFFDELTPFRDHISGRLGMAGAVALSLDRHALPLRTSVGGEGGVTLAGGQLVNWKVLQASAARLGLTAFDTIRFRDWGGAFRITGPVVTLDQTVLQGEAVDVRAAGAFDFGGGLDLGATLYLSRELAERASAIGPQLVAATATPEGIPVGIRITGDAAAPRVALDLSEARDNVVAAAREAAEREAREVVEAATDRLAERLELPDSLRGLAPDSLRSVLGDSLFGLLPDSLKLPGDSAASRVGERVRSRLRGLFDGGG